MSLAACIPGLVENGHLSQEQGERALEIYGRLERQHRRNMGPAAAEAMASTGTVEALAREAAQKKRQTLLQIAAQKRALVDMAGFKGGKDPGGAAIALFDHVEGAPYANVEAQRKAILGQAHARMDAVLQHFKRSSIGTARNVADLGDVVRELFGTSTGNRRAAELAEAWTDAAEMLRHRFNAAGGAIGKLEKWGLPQGHDSLRIREAGFDAWRDFITPLLDRRRMIDDETGLPFDDEARARALRDVFDTIRTEGWIKRTPGGQTGRGKLANQRQDHRFLHFADADGWMAYNQRFGASTPFEAMMGHLEGMSRDIAHMEILGPNPAATVKWLQDGLAKTAALDGGGKMLDRLRGASERVGKLYEATSGAMNMPVNTTWARRLGTVRSLLTSAMLGSASLSAITDVGFQRQIRAFNGLPQMRALTGYISQLKGANRRTAVRAGLIAEEASKIMAAQHRYTLDSQVHKWAGWLSDNVLRWSGLSPWTQGGRWAFGMDFLGALADSFDRGWSEVDPTLRGAMERYGFDETEWNSLRSTPLHEEEGTTFLRPQDIAEQRVADRMLRMIQTETDFAVPTATVRARSYLNADRPGTFWGEVTRNVALFKSFGVSMIMTHAARAASLGPANAAGYAASLVLTTTVLGALAIQAKEISKGKDPRPMDSSDFIGAAMLQGGGFGVFGDFLNSAESRFGGGPLETAAGPVAGLTVDVSNMTVGNLFRTYHALTGRNPDGSRPKGPNLGRDAAKLAQRYTPGSSLWYSRLAFQRIILDTAQEWTDPDYRQAFARMERRARDQGQQYWWRPGKLAPERAPDLDAATASEE
ncbi:MULTISPECIES: hypothetical protein [unclassified Sphingomonas]|uniref:hypothetical protein n=1 Tax=unclassified Sphingomonas TaxID=196159 RepID=UPI0006F6EF19|nr:MULTISPECIES: hypothetical protein [unclassified Sphingomonas]KQX19331.1 hypothetical protein ASD17_12370 [Sphingomonas sp. Root1294]KQY65534.1 hypothetical protein ASD39_15570 [Sphingomonas sp. Root50]KRB95166.1 hypothetical protein ASE22_04490 [Sphingomonas sp. Root720]